MFQINTTKQAAMVACFVVIAACKGQNAGGEERPQNLQAEEGVYTASTKRMADFEKRILPEAIACIQSGDLVTRYGNDLTSFLLVNMNPVDKSFSHCGVASIEKDTVFIYHAIGGEFNPDQKLKRETLFSFAHPADNKALGIFKPELQAGALPLLLQHVKKEFAAGLRFDMDFDLQTDDRQYCSEFAAKSYGLVWEGLSWVKITEQAGRRFIPVDALFLNEKMKEKKRWSY